MLEVVVVSQQASPMRRNRVVYVPLEALVSGLLADLQVVLPKVGPAVILVVPWQVKAPLLDR